MNFYDGYNYRLNISGSDSSIIVDSNNNLIRANLVSADDKIIVDINNQSLYGNLYGNSYGNLLTSYGDLVINTETKSLNINEIISREIQADKITSREIQADKIKGKFYGNLYNKNNELVFDYLLNQLTISDKDIHIKILNENNQEILYNENNIGFFSSKKINFGRDIQYILKNYMLNNMSQVTLLNKSNIEDRDSAGMIEFIGIDQEKLKNTFFGSIGFVVNDNNLENLKRDDALSNKNIVGSDFIVINGRKNYDFTDCETGIDFVNNNMLIFDAEGTLSVPIIKTGIFKNLNKINNPRKGMIIFNDVVEKFQGYDGKRWVNLH